ncbi:MAG: hypothetical protein QW724_04975 [Nitrososphaerota archaeon]
MAHELKDKTGRFYTHINSENIEIMEEMVTIITSYTTLFSRPR